MSILASDLFRAPVMKSMYESLSHREAPVELSDQNPVEHWWRVMGGVESPLVATVRMTAIKTRTTETHMREQHTPFASNLAGEEMRV